MSTHDPTTRRCMGSSHLQIEAHDADPGDFPVQPSQKDGLGRMCKPHWRAYTNALRKAAVARKAELEPAPEPEAEPVGDAETPAPRPRRTKVAADPEVDEADAG